MFQLRRLDMSPTATFGVRKGYALASAVPSSPPETSFNVLASRYPPLPQRRGLGTAGGHVQIYAGAARTHCHCLTDRDAASSLAMNEIPRSK